VHQCEVKAKVAVWKKWSEEMHRGSLAMIEALKAKNPAALREAVKLTRTSCTECHAIFRDEK